jgi:hypothetical protein
LIKLLHKLIPFASILDILSLSMSVNHLIAGAILSSQLELVAIFDKMPMLSSFGGEIMNWITNEKRVDDKPWE